MDTHFALSSAPIHFMSKTFPKDNGGSVVNQLHVINHTTIPYWNRKPLIKLFKLLFRLFVLVIWYIPRNEQSLIYVCVSKTILLQHVVARQRLYPQNEPSPFSDHLEFLVCFLNNTTVTYKFSLTISILCVCQHSRRLFLVSISAKLKSNSGNSREFTPKPSSDFRNRH